MIRFIVINVSRLLIVFNIVIKVGEMILTSNLTTNEFRSVARDKFFVIKSIRGIMWVDAIFDAFLEVNGFSIDNSGNALEREVEERRRTG